MNDPLYHHDHYIDLLFGFTEPTEEDRIDHVRGDDFNDEAMPEEEV